MQDFNLSHRIRPDGKAPYIAALEILQPINLLKNYFHSLADYQAAHVPVELIRKKLEEGIFLLLHLNNSLKNALFDFSEPGKIDLEEFMNRHFKFNVHLERFAYLTGRSISTFKRDFKKTFQVTPNKWLQKKRLQEAHYLIKEKRLKPSNVYLEVGFEDLSHFSNAFKRMYGTAPSHV